MPTTIAILNQKGGVGKTTTAVTLASGLARIGLRVLLIDLDTQGNVADSLGLPHGDDLRRLLSPDLNCPLEQAVTPSGVENLDVIRSDKSTTALKQTLAGVTLREYILADVLQNSGYDLILLDCAPSVDLLHFAALVAADLSAYPYPAGQAGGERRARCAADSGGIEAHQPVPGGRHSANLLRAGDPGKPRAADPPGADLRPAGAAAHPPGYPMPGGDPLREDPLGLRPERQSIERLRAGQQAHRRLYPGFGTHKGVAMKNAAQQGFTSFDDLPGVDPAVESLLGQGQRRQVESHLPKNERSRKKKERERAQKRIPGRIGLDLPVELKTSDWFWLKKKECRSANWLRFSFMSPFICWNRKGSVCGDIRRFPTSPKFDSNLDLQRKAKDVTRNG